ncbi:MAG TPA: hypothetical protein ENN43_00685 [bacterium]|nr:hypothetical protein [bacterium]
MHMSERSGVVFAHFSGGFDAGEARQSCERIKEAGMGAAKGYVFDFTEVQDGFGVFDAYSFLEIIADYCGDFGRIAILKEIGASEGEAFCVEIGKDKGLLIKGFDDSEEAARWAGGEEK